MTASRTGQLQQICRAYGVALLYAFGSRARELYAWLQGERLTLAGSGSDIDIGAYLPDGRVWPVQTTVAFAQALERLLGVERVDLVILNTADPFVAANVVRGERIYERDTFEADEYDLFVLRRAGNLAPLERERLALILQVRP